MVTCWDKIRLVEEDVEQQRTKLFIAFIQHLAARKLLSRYMFTGFLGGAANSHQVWIEAHKFFGKEQNESQGTIVN